MPSSDTKWSPEELEATMDTYADMLARINSGEQIIKMDYYRGLAQQYGRKPSAYRRRFYNISYVLTKLGVTYMPGMAPLAHMGTKVEEIISKIIARKRYFDAATATLVPNLQTPAMPRPVGNPRPPRRPVLIEQIVRDQAVVDWVLAMAGGHCENCGQPAPFVREDGTPYLEVHHVKWLAQDGSDTVTNAVALCPNCHRRFHYGVDAAQLVTSLIGRVSRLVAE